MLYLQGVLGYDALATGTAFLPLSIAIGTLSLGFSARLNTRFGARAVLLPALIAVSLGLAFFARLPVDGSYVIDLLPAMILLGVGAGLAFPALMTLAMSAATPEDSGLASGLVNTTQQVGGALGVSVLATIAAERTAGEPAPPRWSTATRSPSSWPRGWRRRRPLALVVLRTPRERAEVAEAAVAAG